MIYVKGVRCFILTKLLDDAPAFAVRSAMLGVLRHQYPGAVYHLMAHGVGGRAVYDTDKHRIAVAALARMKLPTDTQDLAKQRKGDRRKVLVACLVRKRTAAGIPWIAKRLAMGQSGSVSRLVTTAVKHPQTVRELEKLSKMLICDS